MDRNREHFRHSVPAVLDEWHQPEYWRERLQGFSDDNSRGIALRYFLVKGTDREAPIIGDCSLTEITRGPMQACYLGYKLDRDQAGQGYMTEALHEVCSVAFTQLELHRIMATYRPGNRQSARVLHRLGFVAEGYARDYLLLDGQWRDHVLTSLINPQHERGGG